MTAAPIPALGLHLQPNEFQAALNCRLEVSLCDSDRRCPYCKSAILDIFGDHAVSCHGRDNIISRHDRVRDTIMTACSSANFSPVCEQKHFLPENNSRPGDVYLPSFFSRTTRSLRRHHYVPTASQSYLKCGEDIWFCFYPSRRQKDWAFSPEVQRYGHPVHTFGVRNFGGLSKTTRKTLKRIALLSDNGGFQPPGLSVALSRLAQGVSISAMRGSATMLIARDSRL